MYNSSFDPQRDSGFNELIIKMLQISTENIRQDNYICSVRAHQTAHQTVYKHRMLINGAPRG